MEVTQAVLKYSDIYGVTFNDKYSDIKTIATKNGFNSKFSVNTGYISQTSTILTNDNGYYNLIEKCKLINCNVKTGKFLILVFG